MLVNGGNRSQSGMRGMSLVELMVGVAVGLFVVAAAALMASNQLTDNRKLLLETQLQQDLRAAADLVARDLRRAGHWGNNAKGGVPGPAAGGIVGNPYNILELPNETVDGALHYAYRRAAGAESFGFLLDSDGVLRSCQSDYQPAGCASSSGYQALSDANTIKIEAFQILAQPAARADNMDAIPLPCPNLCSDGTTDCWPRVALREMSIRILGKSRTDPSVVRELITTVKVRGLNIKLSAGVPAGLSCPGAT